jgi:hypothetical protein
MAVGQIGEEDWRIQGRKGESPEGHLSPELLKKFLPKKMIDPPVLSSIWGGETVAPKRPLATCTYDNVGQSNLSFLLLLFSAEKMAMSQCHDVTKD